MMRRHAAMVVRDPILYLGRAVFFFVTCSIFAVVYWNGRNFTQDQSQNKLWMCLWFVGVPSQMGVVAVYSRKLTEHRATKEIVDHLLKTDLL